MSTASDKAQVVRDEKAAETAYQAELAKAKVDPKAPPPATKTPAAELVRAWAADLTPKNAPDAKLMGPLAWVRGEKVEELVQILAKAGYR